MTEFKPGDIVEVTLAFKDRYPQKKFGHYYGRLKVQSADTQNVAVIKEDGISVFSVDIKPEYLQYVARAEGQKIQPNHVQIGDTIAVTNNSMCRKITVEGEVFSINSSGHSYIFKNREGMNIHWEGNVQSSTIVLVKAGPEKDAMLENLRNADEGTVIKYLDIFAEKNGSKPGSSWTIYNRDSSFTDSVESLRNYIGDTKVKFFEEY